MPGYDEYQDYVAKKRAEKEGAIKKTTEEKAKKEKEQKAEELKKAQEKADKKIHNKKLKVVSKNIKITKDHSTFGKFLKGFFIGQMIAFLIGSIDYVFNRDFVDLGHGRYEPGRFYRESDSWDEPMSVPYGEALKNAYGFGDMKDENVRFQVIANLILTILSLMLGIRFAIKNEKIERSYKEEKLNIILSRLEQMKEYGVDVKQLMKDLEPSINKILKSLSEIDRGYFDNLIAGGLDKASYETCVAIISGYLKSHPKEYNDIIAIIDEATLPEEIKKKYGKGKVISFDAAQAMVFDDKKKKR